MKSEGKSQSGDRKVFGGEGPLALCLSGGGFRATFFHLGVVKALRDLGCLQRVTHIFSVSGGSILAAHLGLNWAAYNSDYDAAFRKLSDSLVRFGRDDMRGRIIRRWLLRQDRAVTLQRQYDTFFKGAFLRELPATPTFHFLTTSITTGRLCAFTREAFRVLHEDGHVQDFPAEAQPVAEAVAASSAFPPLFPPLKLDLRDLPRAQFPKAEYLTDGGIFDNLGISRIHPLVSDATKKGFVRIIVSDASALFDHAPDSRFRLLLSRASRTTDILMQRVASLESEMLQRDPGLLVELKIGDLVFDLPMGQFAFRSQPLKIQRLLKGVRTDFDAFEIDLIRSLVKHGYEVTFQAGLQSGLERPLEEYRRRLANKLDERNDKDMVPWDPCPAGWPDAETMREHATDSAMQKSFLSLEKIWDSLYLETGFSPDPETEMRRDSFTAAQRKAAIELETLITAAAKRSIGIWNRSDWVSWLLAFLALAVVAASAYGIIVLVRG